MIRNIAELEMSSDRLATFQVCCALLGHQGAFGFVKASKWLISEQKGAVNPSKNILCIFIK